jgi:hypothetical protein
MFLHLPFFAGMEICIILRSNPYKMKSFLFSCSLLIALLSSAQSTVVTINECVLDKNELKDIQVNYNTATGEKTVVVNGVRKSFDSVYTEMGKPYAASENWYINNENIKINGTSYRKYGLPRILGTSEITRSGDYKGTAFFVESGSKMKIPEVIYIPVRRGCEFQPYVKIEPPCVPNFTLVASATKVKKGKNVVISLKTPLKGKVTYKWTADGDIIGPKNGKSITVSTKNLPAGELLMVYLEVTINGKICEPVEANISVEVI